MIWKTPEDPGVGSEALARHLAPEIASALGDAGAVSSSALDIAHGVAAYCTDLPFDSVLPSGYLALLASRALWGMGEKDAARQLAAEVPDDVFEGMMSLRSLAPAVWKAFATRLVRPSRWLAGPGGVVWVLDLGRVRPGVEDGLDLALLQALRSLLGTVAPVWDATGGKGALGLRGSAEPARAFCGEVLRRMARERGWVSVPAVLDLDARGARRRARTRR